GEWMAAARRSRGQLLARAIELARGLAAVHRCGLIHRDVKPANVLIGRDGRIRLGDFGLARAPEATKGELAGTPRYMAPEQARREQLTFAADQYAFAVTCIEMWLGEAATSTDAGMAQRAGLPSGVRRLLDRALRQDPSERYASMEDLVSELQRLAKPPRRRAVLATAAVVIAVGVGGAFALNARSSADPCATPPAFDDIWNDVRRGDLTAALRAGSEPFSAEATARITGGLDERAARWRHSHRSVCRATAIDHTQSDVLLDARMQCLDEIRDRMDQAIDVLVHTGAVRAGAKVLDDLPGPELCETMRADEVVLGPAAREGRRVAAATLARGRALERAGSRAEAHAAYASAATDGAPDLAAERELGLGRLADASGDFDAMRDHARAALTAAERANRDDLRAQALAMLMRRVTERLNEVEPARVLLPVLAAMSDGSPAGSQARAESLRALGAYYRLAGDYSHAAAVFARAAKAAKSPFDRARSLGDLCIAFRMAGERGKAERACDDAVTVLEKLLGPDHPMLGVTLANRAAALRAAGKSELALSELGRAVDILERGLGAHHPTTLLARRNVGSLLSEAGRDDEAITIWRTILPEWERAQPNTPRLAALYRDLASSLLATGQRAEAAKLQKRATDLYAALFPDGHPDRALAILGAGEIAIEGHDWSAGCRDAERSRAMLEKLDARDLVIHPLFLLAQCAEHSGNIALARARLKAALAATDDPAATSALQDAMADLAKHRATSHPK
ncbi:MAG TPA: serine/threonine-protein kinase, partial [Kofleriaceae bacterium]|nr:serine/threonine-protein kinase [Kofleriaceae bacterium]